MPSVLTEPKIDCHFHVIDPARFPFSDTPYQPGGAEIAPFEAFERMMALYGVTHGLLVGTNSGYGEDLSPVLDAIARSRGRFKGVAVVARNTGAAELAALKASGIAGVAFNATFHSPEYYDGAEALVRALADQDMFLQLQVEGDQLLHFLPLIEAIPVRLVIDHCGRPDPARGLDQPGFAALLSLGRAGRAVVKLSGFTKLSNRSYPYADAMPFVRALIGAFGVHNCVWASDWPFLRAPDRIDYAPLLLMMAELLPDAADRRAVFCDTPKRVFGF